MNQTTLQQHLDLCNEIYDLLVKENTLLITSGSNLGSELTEKKKNLLEKLTASIQSLKEINEQPKIDGIHRNQLIKASQKLIMKILLLDRENEQLMFKNDFNEKKELFTLPPSKVAALEAYAKSLPSNKVNTPTYSNEL